MAKAVIIEGNPHYLNEESRQNYRRYYDEIKEHLHKAGYDDVVFDPGEDYTTPPSADLWVGHSRGAGRLRFAPKGTRTLDITRYEDGIEEYDALMAREMKKRGYKSVRDFPVHLRPVPGPEHYTLTDRAIKAIEDHGVKTSSTYAEMDSEEAKRLRKAVAKKIEYQKQFDAPEVPSRIYHGSQNKIDKFEARPHYLAEDEPVVFGTPSRAMAISHLAPWRDSDFEQGTYNDDPTLHMTEQYPGAFEKIYKGRKGHLYELDPSNFEWGPQLMRSEFISKEAPEVLNSEELDVYEAMLAEEAAGRLKIHRAKEKTASAQDINSLQYPSEVAPRFQGYVSQKRTKLTVPIEDLPQPPPPANDSEETRSELLAIKSYMEEGKLPESIMIIADRDPENLYFAACMQLGIDPKMEEASVVKEDFNKIAFDLKYTFMRPRPWSLSDYHGVNLNVTVPESADTPSYPSGHAMMGYGLAEFYKVNYPEHSDTWDELADIIQHSRLQAGLHFPSDNQYAKEIVDVVMYGEKTAQAQDSGYTPAQIALAASIAGGVGYGGYKAYQKAQQDAEPKPKPLSTREHLDRVGLGALASTAVYGGARSLHFDLKDKLTKEFLTANTPANKQNLTDFLKTIGTEATPNRFDLTAKDGRKILVDLTPSNPTKATYSFGKNLPDALKKVYTGGAIRLGDAMQTPEVFFHELGHATGKQRPLPYRKPLLKKITKGTSGAAAIAALAGGTASTKEEAEAHNTLANVILGASAANQAPLFVEEARANLRAPALAKSLGYKGPLNKKMLWGSIGAYGLGATKALALPLANKLLASRQLERMSEEKTAQDQNSGYSPAQLALAASIAGGVGYGGYKAYQNAQQAQQPQQQQSSYMPYVAGAGLLAAGILGRGKLKGLLKRKPAAAPTAGSAAPAAGSAAPAAGSAALDDLGKLEKHLTTRMGYTPEEAARYVANKRTNTYKKFVYDSQKADASAARFSQEQQNLHKFMQEQQGKFDAHYADQILRKQREADFRSVAMGKFRAEQGSPGYWVPGVNSGQLQSAVGAANRSDRSQYAIRHVRHYTTKGKGATAPRYVQEGVMNPGELYNPKLTSQENLDFILMARGQANAPALAKRYITTAKTSSLASAIKLGQDSRAKEAVFFGEEALLGGLVGGAVAGEDNRALGAALGAGITSALGWGLLPYTTQPLIKSIANKKVKDRMEAVEKDPKSNLIDSILESGKATVDIAKGNIDPNLNTKEVASGVLGAYGRSIPITMGAAALVGLGARYKDDIMDKLSSAVLSKKDLYSAAKRVKTSRFSGNPFRHYRRRKEKKEQLAAEQQNRLNQRNMYSQRLNMQQPRQNMQQPFPQRQVKTSSEEFTPDFTPEELKELGVYDQVYGDAPSEASMKEWPEHWINKQDPLGWLQWYDRYSEGRRTDDDSRQIKRWKSFKARHLSQYLKNPTPRRAAALRNWGIDVSNTEKLSSAIKEAAKGTATKRDPKKWSAAKSRAKAKMGGKWSARAAQLAVKYYKGSGGKYKGKKPSAKNNKLKKWTKEEWGYRPGSKAEKDSKKSPSSGTKGRYLPKKKWQSLSKSEQRATDAKKKRGMKQGKGIVANTAKAKYDSKKDYTKKAELLSAILQARQAGQYLGSQLRATVPRYVSGARKGIDQARSKAKELGLNLQNEYNELGHLAPYYVGNAPALTSAGIVGRSLNKMAPAYKGKDVVSGALKLASYRNLLARHAEDAINFGVGAGASAITGGDLYENLVWGGAGALAGRAGALASRARQLAGHVKVASNPGRGLAKAILNDADDLASLWKNRENLSALAAAGIGGTTGAISAEENKLMSALLGAGAGFGLSKGVGATARGFADEVGEAVGKAIKPSADDIVTNPAFWNIKDHARRAQQAVQEGLGAGAETAVKGIGEGAALRAQYLALPAAAGIGSYIGNEMFSPNYSKKQYNEQKRMNEELLNIAREREARRDLQEAVVEKTAKDNHVEQRRKERASHLPKSVISKLKKAIEDNQKKIPSGSHHIKLPGAAGILKDLGNKHVLATIYGPKMKPPGIDVSKFIKKHPYTVDAGLVAADIAIKGGALL